MFNKRKSCFLILTFILISALLTGCFLLEDDTDLSIHIIDVGQGDSIFIRTPNGKTMLIDAGEAGAGKTVVSYLEKHYIDRIDVLIATHPHADHIGGLGEVIKNFEIGQIYMPRKMHTSKTYERLLETIRDEGLKITEAKSDINIELDEDVNIYFLNPLRDFGDNLNLWSVVLKMEYGDNSFMFTGDLEAPVETEIIETYGLDFLKSDFLKVGHHGSNTSTSQEFLDAIQPIVASISCKTGNSYGHPHKEVLGRLNNMGINVYRTDKQGDIVIRSDGEMIWSNQEPYHSNNN